jgi:hypothetical protein
LKPTNLSAAEDMAMEANMYVRLVKTSELEKAFLIALREVSHLNLKPDEKRRIAEKRAYESVIQTRQQR